MNGLLNPRGTHPLAAVISGLLVLAAAVCVWLVAAGHSGWHGMSPPGTGLYVLIAVLVVGAWLVPRALMVANQWEKAIILRLGKLQRIQGPGLFLLIPFIDTIAARIDQRIQTIDFNAEQALTKDTVPVHVDAIVFWQVHDAEKAALEITDYAGSIGRVAQTSLREMIGTSPLTTLLSERRQLDERLKDEIGRKIADWGVSVMSVEIRDVAIPSGLQDAMSRQAQAEREKEARVILGASEQLVAQKFLEAAEIYAKNPAALQLRAMNIIYETTKERGATILVPTSMVDSLNPGGVLGLVQAAEARK